jgi:hypothetical protein
MFHADLRIHQMDMLADQRHTVEPAPLAGQTGYSRLLNHV